MDASFIIYGAGLPTPNIPIATGQDLQTILQNIDAAIGAHSTAPDYSTFNLHCIDPGHTIVTTQQFAEAITSYLCTLSTAYTTFTGTTYVADQAAKTAAINALQYQGLTYAPFSITTGDSNVQVWNKAFTGFTAMTTYANSASASWSSIGASTPANLANGFDSVITYVTGLNTAIGGKQASLGTFDTTAIGGTTGKTPIQAINALVAYTGALSAYNSGSVTWGSCVSSSSDINGALTNTIAVLSALAGVAHISAGTGLTDSSLGSCSGKSVSVNTNWTGLYKTAVSSSDANSSSGGYLSDKIVSTDTSVTITNTGTTLDLSVAAPTSAYKVKIGNSDASPGYLGAKLTTISAPFGIGINMYTTGSDTAIAIDPIVDAGLLVQSILSAINDNPSLMTQFCALIAQCSGCSCAAPSALTVTATTI